MKRTTIFADENLIEELKELSREEKRSVADIVREALESYVGKKRRRKRGISFVGIGKSGRSDVAERQEELLWKRPQK